MQYVGFWKRLLSYAIDIVPIFLIVFLVAYFFMGFEQTLSEFLNSDRSFEAREYFLVERNKIRDSALLLWILYGLFMDCSRFQGTHGKMLLKIKVVNVDGQRISFTQSIKRTSMKIVGALPLYLGYLWAAFRADKAAWHDLAAKTRVVKC